MINALQNQNQTKLLSKFKRIRSMYGRYNEETDLLYVYRQLLMQPNDIVLVITSVPDLLLAKRIAHLVIEEGLAACVQIGSPVLSVYSWKGDVEGAEEIPLQFKTTWARQDALVVRIKTLHPYEVPEIIVVPVIAGDGPYLDWVREITGASIAS